MTEKTRLIQPITDTAKKWFTENKLDLQNKLIEQIDKLECKTMIYPILISIIEHVELSNEKGNIKLSLSLCICNDIGEILLNRQDNDFQIVGKLLQNTEVIKENIQNIIDIYNGNLKINIMDGIDKKEFNCMKSFCKLISRLSN